MINLKQHKCDLIGRIVLVILLHCQLANAQNPIIRDIGMSDPHVRIFNDTIFLFTGHDAHPDDKTWVMRDWRIFSSTDLINWNYRNTISPANNYMGSKTTDCWAGDAISRNGKYHFYFSDRKRSVGVMVSDSPAGEYKDALGKPLVAPMHDPTILVDDDGTRTPYIIYGDKEGGGYHIAKLNEDMISLAETPKAITIEGEEWENAPQWMDKNYLFKSNGTYYLSWGRDYATSNNIYGPYVCRGAVGDGHHLSEYAHGSFFHWRGQFYHIWTYYLRQGFKYRESIISYCHMSDDGEIVTDTDFLDKHFEYGVGRYDASWPKIEAEWYTDISPGVLKRGSRENGFSLTNLAKGSWVKFAQVDFGVAKISRQVILTFNDTAHTPEFLVRLNNAEGQIFSGGKVIKESIAKNSLRCSVDLEEISGVRDLYIVFNGSSGRSISFDSFQIVHK